jgi:hypothetical protein
MLLYNRGLNYIIYTSLKQAYCVSNFGCSKYAGIRRMASISPALTTKRATPHARIEKFTAIGYAQMLSLTRPRDLDHHWSWYVVGYVYQPIAANECKGLDAGFRKGWLSSFRRAVKRHWRLRRAVRHPVWHHWWPLGRLWMPWSEIWRWPVSWLATKCVRKCLNAINAIAFHSRAV